MSASGLNVYGAGGVGSPSTGAEGSSRPSSPASLSDDRVDVVMDHQATAVGLATGEEVSGAGTMSAPASVSGRRGRGVRAAASGAPRRAPPPRQRPAEGDPPPDEDHASWFQVVSRKERKRKAAAAAAAPAPPQAAGAKTQRAAQSSGKRDGGRRPPRVPTRAAVTLTVAPGSKTPYAEVMGRAVAGVPLAEVSITDLRYRKGQTGSSILEVPGPESSAKADALAARLAEVFRGTDVRVTRPAKTAEMRLAGLDESVTAETVAAAVARVGGCTVAEVRPGVIRRNASGLGTVWLRPWTKWFPRLRTQDEEDRLEYDQQIQLAFQKMDRRTRKRQERANAERVHVEYKIGDRVLVKANSDGLKKGQQRTQ
ncbi:hypothetical protein WN55_08608 [Dufourea novaeangliae]|uniref:Uncharacterized protein n=1 Tax=Dufourea novaeangliae TaxID=178035 RepID=A0A154PUA4_DUFNO|nr:hypothetical protein WN55_08608 [Dufourea novaeangliae]